MFKINNQQVDKEFFEFNKQLNDELKSGTLKSFEVDHNDTYFVDIENQKIYKNGELIKEEQTILSNKRWIHFRRVRIDMLMGGHRSETVSFGVGFQGNLNDQSVKCEVLI